MKGLWLSFALLSFSSTQALADAVLVSDYNGFAYQKARPYLLNAGWVPLRPEREPNDNPATRQFKEGGEFEELERCFIDLCVFRFERGNELLGVWVKVDADNPAINTVDKAYLNLKDGAARPSSETATVAPQALSSDTYANQKTSVAMTDDECLKVRANLFYYLLTAGIREDNAKFVPMRKLIDNGSFKFESAFVKDGECYQTILVDGAYLGTSYRQKLTGVAKEF